MSTGFRRSTIAGAPEMASDLFMPVQLGPLRLANRIVMAPLTRSRADDEGVPSQLMAEYYAQRASAGLIIAEGPNISPQGRGYALTPGLYSGAQVEGWRAVTQAVHARGGRIFPQLWHVGRISHPRLLPGGALPVAPSAIRPDATSYTGRGFEPCVTPRALDTQEIPNLIDDYRMAARNALAAGFDGVEIPAANGYLIEQFLPDSTNKRTDAYGGSPENRARLLLEVAGAVAGACGGERVGIRLSPLSSVNGAELDSDPAATYGYVVKRLNELQRLRRSFNGCYMANNGYDLALALKARQQGLADLISFGRLYIANPDLVERFERGAPLNVPNRATFFGGGAAGYTDYPVLNWSTFG